MEKEYLSPKSDIIFKLIFGDERSIEILTGFLKAVLDIPESDYENVSIVDPHLLRQHEGDKLGILDVKVKTKSQKVIDIEIQIRPKPHLEKRVVLYLSKMVVEQIGTGRDYAKIQRAISIIITDYTLKHDNDKSEKDLKLKHDNKKSDKDLKLKHDNKYHNRYSLCDKTGKQFTDILEVNTLELSKLPETADGTALWAWLKFLKSESKEEFEMVAEKNPTIGKAVARLVELSQDERTRMLYESRQMLEWDIDIGKRTARQEGILLVARNW